MKRVLLGRDCRHETWVSDCDYDWVIQWCWNWKQSSKKWKGAIYARRTQWLSHDSYTTLQLSYAILERAGKPRPSSRHQASHENGNSLDNTRENLEWRTRKQNVKIRERHRAQRLKMQRMSPSEKESTKERADALS